MSIDGAVAAEVAGHPASTPRHPRARPRAAHGRLLGARHGRQPLRAVRAVRARRHASHAGALLQRQRARGDGHRRRVAHRQPGRADRRRDRRSARAAHAAADVRRRRRAGRASPRPCWRAAGCACACRRSTRSGTPPPSPRRGSRPGRDEAPPQRSARTPHRAGAVAARRRARRELRQRPRGDPLAGGGRRSRDRRRPPLGGARLPLAARAPRALARSEGRGRLRRVPGRARRALLLGARRRVPDARRAARRRRAQRRSPGRLPAARAAAGTCSSRCSASATSTPSPRAPASACRSPSRPTREDEARVAAAALSYPAVVKPGDPIPFKRRFGRPVIVCDTPDELIEAWRSAADCEPLLQEVIPGDDSTLWTVGSYTDSSGTALGRLLRPQARADAARLRHLPRGRGALARRRRRAGAHAAAGAAASTASRRRSSGSIPATALQADGGQPAPLAVARPGAGLRRRSPAHRLPRRARPLADPGAAAARSTTAAAGSWRPRTCAPRGRRAPRCAARCARSAREPVEGTFDLRDPLPAIVQASGLVTAPIARVLHRRRRSKP